MGLFQLEGIPLGTEKAPTLLFHFLLIHIYPSILSIPIFRVPSLLQFILHPRDPERNQTWSLIAKDSQFSGDNPSAWGEEVDAWWGCLDRQGNEFEVLS